MSYSGWYKRRRGVLEHLEAGRISLLDLAVHDLICRRANAVVGNGSALPPGVWFGSGKAIHALCPREITLRAVQRSLEHLEKIGWIKRWMRPGRQGNYPILIARYSVTDLSSKEYIVNAEATTDWRQPRLEPVTEPSSLRSGLVAKAAPYREIRNKKREESIAFAGKHLRLTGTQLQAFKDAFPGLDIEAEIRKADAWCVANPQQAPRMRHARFVNSWLSRTRPAKGNGHAVGFQSPPAVGDADPRRQVSKQGQVIYQRFEEAAQ